ncbi:hypothetical protein FHG87_020047 [Trinorchestia longiramus]|nr:hypothetical protein FHG87_020047 [Trinorchestia longiramus]
MEHQIHYTGAMDVRCQFCGALRFQREQLNCGHNGKVSLPPLQEYLENLRLLFDADVAEEDQQLRYFLQMDKITSFDAFKPERNLQKQYKNLIISRSKERLVCLFMTDNFSECSLSVIVENKPTLCSPLTLSAFKNGISTTV